MSRKFVMVDDNCKISLLNVTEEEMANSSMYSARELERIQQSFQEVLNELIKMGTDNEHRTKNAAEFLRAHGTWLHNLAKTGFAIEYSQYCRSETIAEEGYCTEQGIPCEHDTTQQS